MTKQDKELLIKDLYARLPYGVKCYAYQSKIDGNDCECNGTFEGVLYERFYLSDRISVNGGKTYDNYYLEVKPYLRPMSSMTEEEIKELVKVKILSKYGKEGNYVGLNNIKSVGNPRFSSLHNEWFCYVTFNSIDGEYTTCFSIGRVTWETTIAEIDLLNEHHIDFRGLIPMGLALPAPEGMYDF